MTGLIISGVLYLVILTLFILFGRFLKDVDERMHEQIQRKEKENDSH